MIRRAVKMNEDMTYCMNFNVKPHLSFLFPEENFANDTNILFEQRMLICLISN